MIGDVERCRTKAAATSAVENVRAEINAREQRLQKPTFTDLWGHFQVNELRNPAIDRSETTISNYLVMVPAYALPQWGKILLEDIKPVAVERWLHSLPYAPGTKAKIKGLMSSLFEHGIRWEMIAANPMHSVRQGAKRKAKPDILTLAEIKALMPGITTPAIRVAVLVAAMTGLRRSEVRGLKWEDISFDQNRITPVRGLVGLKVTKLKTEASRAGVPIHSSPTAFLAAWRKQCFYPGDQDWVFASVETSGRSPYWFDSALMRELRPAAERAGIHGKRIGWHTFRRSLATLLQSKQVDIKVTQELLRHANSRVTMDLYIQAIRMPRGSLWSIHQLSWFERTRPARELPLGRACLLSCALCPCLFFKADLSC